MSSKERSPIRIIASPSSALIDATISIKVTGLESGQHVTLAARVQTTEGHVFVAHALYTADSEGALDMGTDPSQGGSFTGESDDKSWSLQRRQQWRTGCVNSCLSRGLMYWRAMKCQGDYIADR